MHNHQHPASAQCHRFALEQIDAVKAVFRVTNESKSGGNGTIHQRAIMRRENPADDVLINGYTEKPSRSV
jgi:hypothetical protein